MHCLCMLQNPPPLFYINPSSDLSLGQHTEEPQYPRSHRHNKGRPSHRVFPTAVPGLPSGTTPTGPGTILPASA
jgi:hypothetical protein